MRKKQLIVRRKPQFPQNFTLLLYHQCDGSLHLPPTGSKETLSLQNQYNFTENRRRTAVENAQNRSFAQDHLRNHSGAPLPDRLKNAEPYRGSLFPRLSNGEHELELNEERTKKDRDASPARLTPRKPHTIKRNTVVLFGESQSLKERNKAKCQADSNCNQTFRTVYCGLNENLCKVFGVRLPTLFNLSLLR